MSDRCPLNNNNYWSLSVRFVIRLEANHTFRFLPNLWPNSIVRTYVEYRKHVLPEFDKTLLCIGCITLIFE